MVWVMVAVATVMGYRCPLIWCVWGTVMLGRQEVNLVLALASARGWVWVVSAVVGQGVGVVVPVEVLLGTGVQHQEPLWLGEAPDLQVPLAVLGLLQGQE